MIKATGSHNTLWSHEPKEIWLNHNWLDDFHLLENRRSTSKLLNVDSNGEASMLRQDWSDAIK